MIDFGRTQVLARGAYNEKYAYGYALQGIPNFIVLFVSMSAI
jgi:hypothetical protein